MKVKHLPFQVKILVKQQLKEEGIEQLKCVKVEEIVRKILPKAKQLVLKEHLDCLQANAQENSMKIYKHDNL